MEVSSEEEQEHFRKIVRTFKLYRKFNLARVEKKLEYVKTLSPNHQKMLEGYVKHLENQKPLIEHNGEICKLIIEDVDTMFNNVQQETGDTDIEQHKVTYEDVDRVSSTLNQLMRDWSTDGEMERAASYTPIIQQIIQLFPHDTVNASKIRILVPGAGLGRLAYELAKCGFSCQGNEFSLYMLFASNYVLNKCRGANSLRIFPWVTSSCNVVSDADQLRPVLFPDVEPTGLPPGGDFTMAAGDFLEIYKETDSWDCVATSFFIDCALNIVAFVETIFYILKPGGYWVNLGPLLYHFADHHDEGVELSYEQLKMVITNVGFQMMTKEDITIDTTYTRNVKSMMKRSYDSIFFVACKPI